MKKIISAAESFIQSLTSPKRCLPSHNPDTIVGESESSQFQLATDEYSKMLILVDELYASVPSIEDFTREKISRTLEQAILRAVLPDPVHPYLRPKHRLRLGIQILEEVLLALPVKWHVFFPVENLEKRGLPRNFGSVRFHAVGRSFVNKIAGRCDKVAKGTSDSEDVQRWFRKHVYDRLQDEYIEQKTVAAEIPVYAVTIAGARVAALRELRLTLDVLNFYADILTPIGTPAYVYLPGEASRSATFSPVFEANDESASYDSGLSGAYLPMQLRGPSFDQAVAQRGFEHVSKLLATPEQEKSSLEVRLLAALRWAGRATLKSLVASGQRLDSVREESFLYYAIALETLFTSSKEKTGITDRLSMRCALVISHPHRDISVVESLRHSMSELYGVRSRIVHNGSTIVTDNELRKIRRMSKNVILKVLLDAPFTQMKDIRAFEHWCDQQSEIHRFALKMQGFDDDHLDASKAIVETAYEIKRTEAANEFFAVVCEWYRETAREIMFFLDLK